MAQNDCAVAGEVEIGFNAGNADVESRLEGRQRVFRLEAASASMALQVEQSGKRRHGASREKRTSPGGITPGEADVKKRSGVGKCVLFPDPRSVV